MSTTRQFHTADLSDAHPDACQIAEPIFRHYGGRAAFSGQISTLKLHEDNGLVRTVLSQKVDGKVLVVDGGGSMRCALFGDQLALLAKDNGWSGVVVFGCIRDSALIGEFDIGVRALGTHPRKTVKRSAGQTNVDVRFAGVVFEPGHFLYADADGIVVAAADLLAAP